MAHTGRSMGWASAAFLLAACGGGGGGGPPAVSVALWDGQYHEALVQGPGSGVHLGDVTAGWAVAAADGAGAFSDTWGYNLDGSIREFPWPGVPDVTYAVDSDRTLHLSTPGGEIARGAISEDGSLALLAPAEDGDGPGIRVLGRREGTWPSHPLSGTWRFAAFSHSYSIPWRSAAWGTMTFDASGGGSASITVNASGGAPASSATALDYVVLADGTMLVEFTSGYRFQGGIARGGDVILLAGGVLDGQDPTYFVLVREGVVPTLSSLAGSWYMTSFGYDLGPGSFLGFAGRATTDAAGILSATITANEEGTYTPLPPVGGSWSVDGAGLITLTLSGGATFVGRVDPGGDLVVLAGGTSALQNPMMFVLLR